MHTSYLALPETPQIASATVISRVMNNICIILVQWNPPAGSIGSDVDSYRTYVPSRNINVTSISTLSPLTVMNCDNDVRVQVAAVSGLGCVGQNSSEVQPDLLDVSTEDGSATTEDGSATTATIEGGSASTSSEWSSTILVYIIPHILASLKALCHAMGGDCYKFKSSIQRPVD